MAKSITPRGVGRPDNEREVHRSAVPTPLIGQTSFSTATDFDLSAGEEYKYITISLNVPDGYRLIIRKIIVSIHQNLLIAVSASNLSWYHFCGGFGYKIVELTLYPGFPTTEDIKIYVRKYSSDEINGSITILGILEYTG